MFKSCYTRCPTFSTRVYFFRFSWIERCRLAEENSKEDASQVTEMVARGKLMSAQAELSVMVKEVGKFDFKISISNR